MSYIVYLAGAISCYINTEQQAYPKVWRDEAKKYVNRSLDNITIISPTDYFETDKNFHKSESEVMRFNLRMVREADAILVNLKNLHNSIETADEIFYAYIKGKPIIGFLEDESEYKNIHPWKMEQIDRIETGGDSMKKALDYIYGYYAGRYN